MPQPRSVSSLNLLPSVDKILNREEIKSIRIDFHFKVRLVRQGIEKYRRGLLKSDKISPNKNDIENQIAAGVEIELRKLRSTHLKRVVNATGIILHTNLGRAPFTFATETSWQNATQFYSNLEIDLAGGKRGERISHVEDLLKLFTGAESVLVVNNNAAAVLVTLNTLGRGKEVVISRGQLIEIGGGFRIPEVIERSGAIIHEVGTTNKTRIDDYRKAIQRNTAMILKVHSSNYRVLGFTEDVDLKDLVDLGKKKKIPFVYDLGGGVLVDLKKYGLPYEPVVGEIIQAGVDIAMFSGDKILGGPQCGIIVGKKKYIDLINKNHLLRALRCDKMVYAILESTLKLFLHEEELLQKHPVMRMLTEPADSVKVRAGQLAQKLKSIRGITCSVEPTHAQAGSGALPLEKIDSWAVAIKLENLSAEKLSSRLREMEIPVIGTVTENKFYLDMRTVSESEVELVYQQFQQIII